MTRVLVVGLPRSATTWVGRCLGHAAGVRYVNEPDNENIHPYAVRAKRGLGRYPILARGDQAPIDYERLWEAAAAGFLQPGGVKGRLSYRLYNPVRWQAHPEGQPALSAWGRKRLAASAALSTPGRPASSFEHLVVKSVFVPFALEWLVERWDGPVIVAVRDPLNTIASWWSLGWRDVLAHHPAFVASSTQVPNSLAATLSGMRIPPLVRKASELQRLTWQFGLLSSILMAGYRRHPGWVLARHDELCVGTVTAFQALFDRTGLPWSDEAHDFLLRSNRPSAGAFDTTRIARSESTRWRERLTDEQVAEVSQVIDDFDLGR